MIKLAPKWAYHYDEFWKAIKVRNLWLIKLRYLFVAALILFFVIGEFLFEFDFSEKQAIILFIIVISILCYNIILDKIRKYVGCTPGKFNSLHLSLIQSTLDLGALLVLVYYTGIIHSPLYYFFVFHTIIGSLILPVKVIYFLSTICLLIFNSLILLQHYSFIPTHNINGIVMLPQNHSINYDLVFIIIFNITILFSIYLANYIASQLYKREQQLRNSLEKLKDTEIAKQKYIMGIVHEIKTPISAVISLLDILLGNYLGPIDVKIEDKLKRAKSRSDEAINMINNVLRISKLKLLDLTTVEDIAVEEIIKSALERFADKAAERHIYFSTQDNRKYKYHFYGDRLLIDLAFSNIVNNSIKYIGFEGHINIELYESKEFITIIFEDDGIGIPKEDLEKVTEQFFRASNTNKNQTEGSGMGLSLVKEIIEKHKGHLHIDSPSRIKTEKRPGTVVIIELPLNSKKKKSEITFEDHAEIF
jgi:signal transduction histidine kinase